MRPRILLPLFAAAMLVAAAAVAQPQGHYWTATPLAGWLEPSSSLLFPGHLPLKAAPIVGGRLGRQFDRYWGLEVAGDYAWLKEDGAPERHVGYPAFSGNAMYTPVRWSIGAPYVAAGWGWTGRKYKPMDTWNYMTFEQAVGWNSWFTDHFGMRLEARNVINLPHKDWGAAHNSDQQYWAGLSWAWGSKPVDTDGDGVPDKKDRCPATPTGATVDATGCPKDSDGDGVYDGLDKCPGTPRGATVDASGCTKDSDGDGVLDGLDKCPNTPRGATVDASGCPMDTDGDGVWDGLDKCPNTPKGAVVDANGCPTDSDGDGVYDGLDKCPNTPQGAKVDAEGCPIEVTEKETQLLDTGMIRLQNVNFETAKATLLPESLPLLDEVGPILLKWPQLKIEVGGHTDSRGKAASNQVLSEARAQAVRTYLMQKFPALLPDQLSVMGYGSTRPIAPNNNALNMAKNRRVEFVVLNKDVLKKEVERRKMLQK